MIGILLLTLCSVSKGLPLSANSRSALQSVSGCMSSSAPSLQLQCPPKHMIHVDGVRYGLNNHSCQLGSRDCQFPAPEANVIKECTGQPSCKVATPSLRPSLPQCSGVANVFAVDFFCVPESSVHDVCAESEVFELSGYIRTPRYPVNYPPDQHCSLNIRVGNNYGLKLTVIDMNVAKGETTDCDDYLYVGDGLRTVSICSEQVMNVLFDTDSSHIQVQFQSNSAKADKGFFLYYEAIRKPEVKTTRSTVAPHLLATATRRLTSARSTASTRRAITTQSSSSRFLRPVTDTWQAAKTTDQAGTEQQLPVGAIIGGLLGSLFALLLALVVLLLLRRCRAPLTSKPTPAPRSGSHLLSAGTQYVDNLRLAPENVHVSREYEPWQKPV